MRKQILGVFFLLSFKGHTMELSKILCPEDSASCAISGYMAPEIKEEVNFSEEEKEWTSLQAEPVILPPEEFLEKKVGIKRKREEEEETEESLIGLLKTLIGTKCPDLPRVFLEDEEKDEDIYPERVDGALSIKKVKNSSFWDRMDFSEKLHYEDNYINNLKSSLQKVKEEITRNELDLKSAKDKLLNELELASARDKLLRSPFPQ